MKKILYAKPSITDLEVNYVNDAIRNGWGDKCYEYILRFKDASKRYFDVEHVWPTSSCHGALHIALMSLGVGPGDEVIVPDSTWIGSVSPIVWLGATPVFADVQQDTWCISPESIENSITEKTKAVIAVHLYGNLCDMDSIMALGKKHNIAVIEDAAEAIGSEYKGRKAGSIGDFGTFSFHGTKTMTTGEGGLLISNRDDLVEKVTIIEGQGRDPKKHIMFWADAIGLKYKMSNLQAALGLAQLERIDELVDRKRQIFDLYKTALNDLSDIDLNPEQDNTKNSYWMPTVVFGDSYNFDRDELIAAMNDNHIAVRPFFHAVSSFPMFSHVSGNNVSLSLCKQAINLPSYYEMTEDDVKHVVDVLKQKLDELNTVNE